MKSRDLTSKLIIVFAIVIFALTPLTSSAQVASTEAQQALVSGDAEKLRGALANGENPNAIMAGGQSLLWEAISLRNIDAARALVVAGAEPDHAGNAKPGPLGLALMTDQAAAVQLLLTAGADANARFEDMPLLSIAVLMAPDVAVDLILAGAETTSETADGLRAADLAAMRGRHDLVSSLGGTSLLPNSFLSRRTGAPEIALMPLMTDDLSQFRAAAMQADLTASDPNGYTVIDAVLTRDDWVDWMWVVAEAAGDDFADLLRTVDRTGYAAMYKIAMRRPYPLITDYSSVNQDNLSRAYSIYLAIDQRFPSADMPWPSPAEVAILAENDEFLIAILRARRPRITTVPSGWHATARGSQLGLPLSELPPDRLPPRAVLESVSGGDLRPLHEWVFENIYQQDEISEMICMNFVNWLRFAVGDLMMMREALESGRVVGAIEIEDDATPATQWGTRFNPRAWGDVFLSSRINSNLKNRRALSIGYDDRSVFAAYFDETEGVWRCNYGLGSDGLWRFTVDR